MTLLGPVVVQTERSGNSPLAKTMRDIRSWLAGERIEPVYLKTVVGGDSLGFEISFRDEHDAERFQQRFASLLMRRAVYHRFADRPRVRRTGQSHRPGPSPQEPL